MKNIVLIGMPGTGKSTIGRILASLKDMSYLDCDAIVEEEYGKRICELFKEFGEEFFRNAETRAVKQAANKSNTVISCGGGVVLREENMTALKSNGSIVWLKASVEKIFDRVKKNNLRPLINKSCGTSGISQTYEIRKPLYEKYSDFEINTDDLSAEEIASKIAKIFS